jgi:hypothetical protein
VKARHLLPLLAALVSSACATVAVNVDYDTERDFDVYRSFRLLPDPPATGNVRADNPLLQQRIRAALAAQLELQGFEASATPQMLVGYHASTTQKLDVRTVDSRYGYGHWRRGGSLGVETEVREYEEGTLVVDIVDAKRDTLVWRGIGRLRLRSNPSPEQVTERVRVVVGEILSRFPPEGR